MVAMETSNEIFIFIGLMCVLLAGAIQRMIPNPPATCVGIDLGTTYSCVAVFEDGDITVINNADRRSITASVLFVRDTNLSEIVVGDRARAMAAREPGTLVYDAKRFIGKRFDAEVAEREARGLPFALVPGMSAARGQLEPHIEVTTDGQLLRFAPEDVGALVVHALKLEAERYVGREVENVVLAVPVGFSALQINATKEAAVLAGFNVLRCIHEPTAAAMAYGLHTKSRVNTVMVYDMGGGTLDVSLLNLNNGIFEVMAAAGDNRLGGQDFNLGVLDALVARVRAALPGYALEEDAEAMRALREEAERIKIELNDECDCGGNFDEGSLTDEEGVEVKLPASIAAAAPILISRAEFVRLSAKLFDRALAPVKQVLQRVGMATTEVDEVVLVGGSTRMAYVRKMLRDHFDQEPNCDVSPEEAVAHGTAIQAAILTDRKKISVGATEAALHQHIEGSVER